MTMRSVFTSTAADLVDRNPRVAIITAVIGRSAFTETGVVGRHPERVVDVGIREQLMIGVAAGMSLEDLRPIAHSYSPFLVERPFEQIKLDLVHQGVGAVLVGIGGSYDASAEGRTHQSPGDVALLATLAGVTVHVPGHPSEVASILRSAVERQGVEYIRLTEEVNESPLPTDGRVLRLREGSPSAPTVLAVGPTADRVLAATRDLDVTVLATLTPMPFDAAGARSLITGESVLTVEPYLPGVAAEGVRRALDHRPIRLLAIGAQLAELRRYGTPAEQRRAHGLDEAGIRERLVTLLGG